MSASKFASKQAAGRHTFFYQTATAQDQLTAPLARPKLLYRDPLPPLHGQPPPSNLPPSLHLPALIAPQELTTRAPLPNCPHHRPAKLHPFFTS
jgi:hypothetical protein